MTVRSAEPAALLALTLGLGLAGCAPVSPPRTDPDPAAEPLPRLPMLPVEQVAPPPSTDPSPVFPGVPELRNVAPGGPITLSASNVDVRALVPVLAEEAGISLVVDPAVEGRVTIHFEEVPALLALRAVLDAAGLGLVGSEPPQPWGPVVFYALPVHIDAASVELIMARFGVSRAAAETAIGLPFR